MYLQRSTVQKKKMATVTEKAYKHQSRWEETSVGQLLEWLPLEEQIAWIPIKETRKKHNS